MVRKNINPNAVLGALNQADKFVETHGPALTAKGLDPAALRAAIVLCLAAVNAAKQTQEDCKSGLKSATVALNATLTERYPEFSSLIDMLRGAVGNRTPLGKQLTTIRKQANRRRVRSSTQENGGNTTAAA